MLRTRMLLLVFVMILAAVVAINAGEKKESSKILTTGQLVAMLKSKTISLSFEDTELQGIVAHLQNISGLNIVIDPEVDAEATLNIMLKSISIMDALRIITESLDKGLLVKGNVIIITEPEDAGSLLMHNPFEVDERVRKVMGILESQRVTLDFAETPFLDAISVVRGMTKLNFVISGAALEMIEDEDVQVNLRLRNSRLKVALGLLFGSNKELRYKIKHGVVYITTAEAQNDSAYIIKYLEHKAIEAVRYWTRTSDFEALGQSIVNYAANKNLKAEYYIKKRGFIEFESESLVGPFPVSRQLKFKIKSPMFEKVSLNTSGMEIREVINRLIGGKVNYVLPAKIADNQKITCRLMNISRMRALEAVLITCGYFFQLSEGLGDVSLTNPSESVVLFPDVLDITRVFSIFEDAGNSENTKVYDKWEMLYPEMVKMFATDEEQELDSGFYRAALFKSIVDNREKLSALYLKWAMRQIDNNFLTPVITIFENN